MSKRIRQYASILVAIISYYVIHEGAHAIYALSLGTFKQVNVMGFVGVQIETYNDRMTDFQLALLCLVGPVASLLSGYLLVVLADKICSCQSAFVKTVGWYSSIVLLLLDPLYLSIFYRFVGGGDMNGIKLLVPEMLAVGVFAIILLLNLYLLFKILLPKYKKAFL